MPVRNYRFVEGLGMLIFDVALYGFIGYYLDQVIPKEFGVAKSWNFLCLKLKSTRSRIEERKLTLGEEEQEPSRKEFFEEVTGHIKRDSQTLKVRNLHKIFSNGKVAVENTSMTLYSG